MKTASPAINFLTAYWDLLQKLQQSVRLTDKDGAPDVSRSISFLRRNITRLNSTSFSGDISSSVASASNRSSMWKAFSWVIAECDVVIFFLLDFQHDHDLAKSHHPEMSA
nr:MAG: hypothetical protein [Bacteriophage sp.]